MTATFLFGIHVIHQPQFAVIGAFTGAALLGIADFSGNRTQRIRVTAATVVVGAGLLALGTWVSENTAAATVTMFVVTLVVGYTAVFSGYFAAASTAVIVFYVVATGVPGPSSVIPAREAGLAVGGILSLIAIGWLWPSRATAECRTSLSSVYRELSAQIGALAGPADGAVGTNSARRKRLEGAILEAERSIARSAWRPDGLAGPHKARMYLLQGARRLSGLIDVYEATPIPSGDGIDLAVAGLIGVLTDELGHCADAMGSLGRNLPEPGRVDRAKEHLATVGRQSFATRVGEGQDPEALDRFAAAFFVLQQMGWGVVLASVHCRAMQGAELKAPESLMDTPLITVLTDGPSPAKWLRRARRNLTLRSVHLQNSLRLAIGLGLARLAVGVFDLQHGFWVGFATLVVLKTSAAGTRSTAVQATIGTAIGFGVSTVFITTFGVDAVIYSIILPLVVFAAFYLPGAVSFVAGQAFFTMVIVVLFNLLKPAGWTVGLVRLEDVLIGAAIGLVIGLALWPRGAASELARVVGRLFVTGDAYARSTVERLVGGVPDASVQSDPVPAEILSVQLAALEAEDVFSQYLSEPHQSDAPIMAWSALMASAHQLWFGACMVGLVPTHPDLGEEMPAMTSGVLEAAGSLSRAHASLARAVADGTPLRTEPIHTVIGPVDPAHPDAALSVFELETWLAEQNAEVERVRPCLDLLRPNGVSDDSARPRVVAP